MPQNGMHLHTIVGERRYTRAEFDTQEAHSYFSEHRETLGPEGAHDMQDIEGHTLSEETRTWLDRLSLLSTLLALLLATLYILILVLEGGAVRPLFAGML